jgi:threonine synthase
MGLPIAELVIGTNRNDILARFINQGTMTIAPVEPSLSPSMDIQISSNFERLLFELKARDGAAVAAALAAFRKTGTLPASATEWQAARALFSAHRVDDEATRRSISQTFAETGELVDPHSAIAVAAAKAARRVPGVPMVALACAHPAKFPDAVAAATGRRPQLPARLGDLMQRAERRPRLPNALGAVEDYVRRHAQLKGKGAAA